MVVALMSSTSSVFTPATCPDASLKTALSKAIFAVGASPTLMSEKMIAPPVVSLSAPSLRSEEHTSELQSHVNLVCRLLLEKKKLTYSKVYSAFGQAGLDTQQSLRDDIR